MGVNLLSDCDYVGSGDKNKEEQVNRERVGERKERVGERMKRVGEEPKGVTGRMKLRTSGVMGMEMGLNEGLKG